MTNKYAAAMQKTTDEQLMKIVTVDKNDYQPLAIEAAEEEIKLRNIDFSKMETIKNEITAQAEEEKFFLDSYVNSGLRLVNFLIDTVIVFAVMIILTLPLSAHNPLEMLLGAFIMIVVFFGYYIFMEYRFQKTVGKMVTKTKVVTNNNEKSDIKTVIIRTLCRLIPFDGISFIFVKNGLHDRLSDTSVVKNC